VGQRRLNRAISALFDSMGYTVRRKRPPSWGSDAFLDQQRWLRDAPVRVVFDVGANQGDTVAQYRALFPSSTIYAFEPFDTVFARLAARFSSEPQVRPQHTAVTNGTGARELFVNDAHQTNSLLSLNDKELDRAMASNENLGRTITVPAITLDAFCAREGIDRIDVLKMDIQGGEGMALEGAASLLSRQSVRLLYLEVLFAELYKGQAYFCDIARILDRHGYQAAGLYNLVIGEGGLGWADAIFRPR
jgi:FkbM family methyltransferase